jgi:hypothetical protein
MVGKWIVAVLQEVARHASEVERSRGTVPPAPRVTPPPRS